MLHKTRSVVLHYVKFGESSIIVTLYTEKFGRLSCIVNGVRSKRSKLSATYFQPLSLLETDIYRRQNKEIQRIKEVNCPFHYNTIPFSPSKSAIAIFLAEVMYLSLHEEESNPLMFSFIYHALQLLDTSDDVSLFHHWFMFHLTKYLGFFPSEQIIQQRTNILPEYHVFNNMSPAVCELLKSIALNTSCPPLLKNITHKDKSDFLERMTRYYAMHVDGFSRLKSYAVLKEVFVKFDT